MFISSSSLSPKVNQPDPLFSVLMASESARRADEIETQNEADDPRPDPRGRSEVTVTLAGLNLETKSSELKRCVHMRT